MCALLIAIALVADGGRPAFAGPSQALGDAFRALDAGDFARARKLSRGLEKRVANTDYVFYVRGQAAAMAGDDRAALADFRRLAGDRDSRFRSLARWRVADCLWSLGERVAAAKEYRALIKGDVGDGDVALGMFRLAEAEASAGNTANAINRLSRWRREHPGHSLDSQAGERLFELGGADSAALSDDDRLARAIALTGDKDWHRAVDELAQIGDKNSENLVRQREFWLAMTLFKRRRHYKLAGDIFLKVYKQMGSRAAEALFHGARALSRADFDKEAIKWYQRVVAEYPRSKWAAEAQYLSGWLEFNMGNYREALPYLRDMRRRYARSQFAVDALWYLGMSHYLLGEHDSALGYFEELGRRGGKEVGGKGRYWKGRALQALGRADEAALVYRELVGDFPFSWYALLSRARLAEAGVEVAPFGESPRNPGRAPELAGAIGPAQRMDPLIRKVDELIAAGLGVEAGDELRRGEKRFLRRHKKPAAMAALLDRYHRAGNYNRPWMLAIVHGGHAALDAEPKGRARIWWEHAYPLAYREHVDKHRALGGSPPYYLYTIMRKESGFQPHTHSYADAQGLLQMIPPTTKRVAVELGMEYTRDLLFDPELNIKVGSWYIGRLLQKFGNQIPIGGGSYNSGPRAVMKWLDKNGGRPIDEFVELVSYDQTRNYMKRITETYARYQYLYDGTIYEQPLAVDRNYQHDRLTY